MSEKAVELEMEDLGLNKAIILETVKEQLKNRRYEIENLSIVPVRKDLIRLMYDPVPQLYNMVGTLIYTPDIKPEPLPVHLYFSFQAKGVDTYMNIGDNIRYVIFRFRIDRTNPAEVFTRSKVLNLLIQSCFL